MDLTTKPMTVQLYASIGDTFFTIDKDRNKTIHKWVVYGIELVYVIGKTSLYRDSELDSEEGRIANCIYKVINEQRNTANWREDMFVDKNIYKTEEEVIEALLKPVLEKI